MLFEYAGEVLPTLGRALNPATFAPYFTGLLPMLLKKTKKHCSVAERSFAVGAIADSMEPLQGVLQPFLQHLIPLFVEMIKDSEDDVRNNAIYGLGETILWGGEAGAAHITTVLANVSKLMQHEACPRVMDQCVGALARCIIAQLTQVPVEELVNGMVSHLPLKEDLEEYELVFKAFLTLFNAGHAVTPQCIPKIVESAAHFTTAHNVEKPDKSKTLPLLTQLLSSLVSSFPGQVEERVGTLPTPQQAAIAALLQS